ncbi:hypothetical protein LBMAG49_10140 [Planctomycetota bacterium]|nr:hypothetical protein LBMAG49_10140 [Planctomycetota bacterium]
MAQFVLEVLDGDRQGDVVSLAASHRIGRRPGNDVVIADEKASGVHAEVVKDGDRYVLRDLGSTNGTMLDGRRVTEVVLNPGDIFMVGRVRIVFRDLDAASPAVGAVDDPSMAMVRIDTSRLQTARPKSSVALLLSLLLAAGAAGGYVWWRGQQPVGEAVVAIGAKGPLEVDKNRLRFGACEEEQGWNLRFAGSGFQLTGMANTGSGGFAAVNKEQQTDFAVATTSEELSVLPNRTVQVAAHVRTEGAARVAVRLHFFSSLEANPFHFRSGTMLQESESWARIEAIVAVPPDADRCRVELVAALPTGGAVKVDDVAVLDGPAGGELLQRKPEEAASTILSTGSSVVIRSMDKEEPAVLLGILPGAAPPGLEGLFEQGLLTFSDLGKKLAVECDARSCTATAEGVETLQLLFTADSANSLMVLGENGFSSTAAASEYRTDMLLLGDRATRCLVMLPAKTDLKGKLANGQFRLTVAAPQVLMVLGFRKERQAAQELLRSARENAQRGQKGLALDQVRELSSKLPHDVELMVQAATLRSDLQAEIAEIVRQLGKDLDDAEFFSTRGGFDRSARGLEDLRRRFSEANLPDPAVIELLYARATDHLAKLDQQRSAEERERLQRMAESFDQAQKAALAKLVREYVTRHLPGGN